MDLDDIRIFTQVIEAGSFTAAAKKLKMPKSTVSRRVGELEDALGIRLIHRTTRKLNLTDAGGIYFARTQRVMEELRNAALALEEMQSEPRGILRLTAPHDMGGELAKLLVGFRKQYPLIQVVLFSTGRRVDLVREGYDLALRAGQLDDSSLVSRKLATTEISLYASPVYLESAGTPSCPSELESHQCLIFGTDSPQGTLTLTGKKRSHSLKIKGPLASNDFGVLKAAACAAQGIALLPRQQAAEKVQSGELVEVLPEFRYPAGGLYAVYPSPRHLSPRVRAFIDFAAEWAKEFMTESGKGPKGTSR